MKKEFLITLSVLFIWTCGGGGGGSTPTEPIGPTEPSAPVVEDILLTTNEDVPSVINLEGTDPANLPLTFTIASQPTNGTFSLSGNAGTYTPNNNFNGSDTFTYFASNGSKSSNQGSVQITINPVNDDPESIDVSVSTNEDNSIDITLQANEYDGDTIVFQIDEQVSNGTLSLSGNIATYVPSSNWYGVDTFKFSVYDSSGRYIIKSGNGTIVVNAINDPPNVNDIYDVEVKLSEVTPIKLNAFDVDSYSVSYQIVDNPSKATVRVSNDTVYFSPLSVGADTFTFEAYDGTNYSEPGSVFVDIYEPNYGGININFMNGPHPLPNHYYAKNGTDTQFTKLNNGNILIASPIWSYSSDFVDIKYEPVVLIEMNTVGQILNRIYLDGLSIPVSEIYAIKQLSNGEIILVTGLIEYDGPGYNYNSSSYLHKLDSSYGVIVDDIVSSGVGYGLASRSYSQKIVELSNGNILYQDKIWDTNLELVAVLNYTSTLIGSNIISYKYPDSSNNYQNQILQYDLNGNLLNTISFDSNSNISLDSLFKTDYGFIGFGSMYNNNSSLTILFDESFNVISYKSGGLDNPGQSFAFQEDDGFIFIGSGYNSDHFIRIDDNGNLLYNTDPAKPYSYSSVIRQDNGTFILIGSSYQQNTYGQIWQNNQAYHWKNINGYQDSNSLYFRSARIQKITNQGNKID